jgi:hypothetical protein
MNRQMRWCGRLALAAMVLGFAVSARAAQSAVAAPNSRDMGSQVHGAIYVAYGAYNAPQMWKNFNADETKRDFGYAKKINVNALRIWASYEYWQTNPADFEKKLDTMLKLAKEDHIRILFSLFENDGTEPTQEHMWDTNPRTALDVQSPGVAIATDPSKWEAPRGFIQWFMKKYANDPRLCGIEVMNEPNPKSLDFAKSMFKTAASMRGTVPLTIGSARLAQAVEFIPLGLNLIEFHQNFPKTLDQLNGEIEAAMAAGKKYNIPVWLTEWQRVRAGGAGFDGKAGHMDSKEANIDYAPVADDIRKYPVGTFFWCLMVKEAYLGGQRKNGTVNGLFWPDGSVWSLKDARAIANNPTLNLKEKPLPADFLDTDKAPQ